jgi:hypothetical protein
MSRKRKRLDSDCPPDVNVSVDLRVDDVALPAARRPRIRSQTAAVSSPSVFVRV